MNKLRWIGHIGDEVRLYRFKELCFNKNHQATSLLKMAIVDVETNGLDYKISSIIELGILVVLLDSVTGELVDVVTEYNHLNDPKTPLDKKIIQVTGLTDEDLAGHEINWDQVNAILEDVDCITSFNAKFDRSFIDVKSKVSSEKKWVCSFDQIPWLDQGFPERSQKNLGFYHGFFYDAHRAINDVFALTHLLTHNDLNNEIYFKTLMNEVEKTVYLILAKKTSFDKKTYFNLKNYQWNNDMKIWYKYYDTEQEAVTELDEIKPVYEDSVFNAEVFVITAKDRFKPIETLANASTQQGKEIKKNDIGKFSKEFVVLAENTPFHTKTILKKRGYDWYESKDKTKKFWYLYVSEEDGVIEKEWLKANVYPEQVFGGRILKNSHYQLPETKD